MLSAAAAVGVSVAFGAPIGGVLFSLEEVGRAYDAFSTVFYHLSADSLYLYFCVRTTPAVPAVLLLHKYLI